MPTPWDPPRNNCKSAYIKALLGVPRSFHGTLEPEVSISKSGWGACCVGCVTRGIGKFACTLFNHHWAFPLATRKWHYLCLSKPWIRQTRSCGSIRARPLLLSQSVERYQCRQAASTNKAIDECVECRNTTLDHHTRKRQPLNMSSLKCVGAQSCFFSNEILKSSFAFVLYFWKYMKNDRRVLFHYFVCTFVSVADNQSLADSATSTDEYILDKVTFLKCCNKQHVFTE